jgi:hypothetical protein
MRATRLPREPASRLSAHLATSAEGSQQSAHTSCGPAAAAGSESLRLPIAQSDTRCPPQHLQAVPRTRPLPDEDRQRREAFPDSAFFEARRESASPGYVRGRCRRARFVGHSARTGPSLVAEVLACPYHHQRRRRCRRDAPLRSASGPTSSSSSPKTSSTTALYFCRTIPWSCWRSSACSI